MKKLILIAGVFLICSQVSMAQLSTADVFKSTEITWYGLDFSNIRLIGALGFTDPYDIKTRFFNSWNNLVIGEPDKYDLKDFFSKSNIEIDLDVVKERNTLPDESSLVIYQNYSISEEKVREILSDYKSNGKEGVGLVFVMESFNKMEEIGHMWVTFFDMSNGNVLFTKHMSGKARGFGLRNYWAKSYHHVMKDIGNKEWKAWKAEQ